MHGFFILFLSLVSLCYGGYVSWCGWEWFLLPLGAPMISYWHAVGLFVLIKGNGPPPSQCKDTRTDDEKQMDALGSVFVGMVHTTLVWIVMALVHAVM